MNNELEHDDDELATGREPNTKLAEPSSELAREPNTREPNTRTADDEA